MRPAAKHLRLRRRAGPELLGEPDEQSLGAADVAEAIHLLVLHHLADQLRAALTEPDERLIDVVHGEHHTQVAERVHRGVSVIGDNGWCEKSRKLEPTVAVRGDHHGDLDTLLPQSGDAPGPLTFDRRSPFELQAELDEERDRGIERFYDDAYVVHPFQTHINSAPFCPEMSGIAMHVAFKDGRAGVAAIDHRQRANSHPAARRGRADLREERRRPANAAGVRGEGDIGATEVCGGEYATAVHRGPFDRLAETYAWLGPDFKIRNADEKSDAPNARSSTDVSWGVAMVFWQRMPRDETDEPPLASDSVEELHRVGLSAQE
jgi:hypothetical protein